MEPLQKRPEALIGSQPVKARIRRQIHQPSRPFLVAAVQPLEHPFIAQPEIDQDAPVRRNVPMTRELIQFSYELVSPLDITHAPIGVSQRSDSRGNVI